MHEWALAEAIVKYATNICVDRSVLRISVALGRLQAVDREVLLFALNSIFETMGMSPRIELRDVEARFRCRKCGYSWCYSDLALDEGVKEAIHFLPEAVHAFVKCPRCGSHDFEIVEGRGVSVEEVVCSG